MSKSKYKINAPYSCPPPVAGEVAWGNGCEVRGCVTSARFFYPADDGVVRELCVNHVETHTDEATAAAHAAYTRSRPDNAPRFVHEYKPKGCRNWRQGVGRFASVTEAQQSRAGMDKYPHERVRNTDTDEITELT